MKKKLKKSWVSILIFSFIIIVGFFLRIYKLRQTTTFLSDQGRDAIIIYEIVTFKHLPAIGAPTSIGQVYLGPFYYYLIAPFLPLFNFDPVGLSFGVALFSTIFIIFCFFLTKRIFNKLIAFIFLFLVSFSSINIEQSRFSWNPNLLPFFSFFTLYFFYKFINEKKLKWAFFYGMFFSLSTQLHYLAILLILPVIFYFIYQISNIENWKKYLFGYFTALFAFCLFSLPLLIFDLRHNFLNSKNLIKLLTEGNLVSQNRKLIFFIIFIGLFFLFNFLKKRKKINDFTLIHLFNCLLYIWGFKLLNTPSHIHYFGSMYLSLFLIIAILINYFKKFFPPKIYWVFISFFLIIYFIFNLKNYKFLWQKGGEQIEHSKKVAQFLADKINNKPYNIASWPVEFAEDNYLYFLILKGLKPANRQKIEITNQMFVLCQKQPCQIIDSPSWNISMFGKSKIDKIWEFENLYIYKLIHEE